jgi:hypothetical protein
MKRIQALSATGAVFLMASVTASAQPASKNQAAQHCTTIVDERQRLQCFDDLYSAKPGNPSAAVNSIAESAWSIVESKSPTDGSTQISAGMVVRDAALILRCREQNTEAAFSTKFTNLGDKPVTVRFRINSEDPIKEAWRPSMDGRAAFAPNPENFIRALPDSGRVFIRAIDADGKDKDANFILSGVSEIRDKIARACNWPEMPDESTGTIGPPQAR